jgi:ABC-type multidrug transport system fused ATPase/permease subunit
MQGRTPFIIAHRLATVRHVDRIIGIAGGRVVESGTHDELQAVADGTYQRVAALQFRE